MRGKVSKRLKKLAREKASESVFHASEIYNDLKKLYKAGDIKLETK